MENSRRNFLKNAAFTAAAIAAIPEIVSASLPPGNKKKKGNIRSIKSQGVILFQGDSITDAGRERLKQQANYAPSFGIGYVFLAACKLLCKNPEKEWLIFNRGISGNKVYQLSDRWQADCFDLKPDLVSILIGVNDFWHTLDGRYPGNIQKFEQDYRQLLMLTTKMLPEATLVIGEPFALKDTAIVSEKWFPAFDQYRAVAKQMAEEFNAIFIPYQSIFDLANLRAPASFWSIDGVHPTMAGAELIAEAWLSAVK